MFSSVLCSLVLAITSQTEGVNLRPGQVIRQALKPGGSLLFSVQLEAGYWRLGVKQEGIDVVVEVLDKENRSLVRVDSPLDEHGQERLLFEANNSGLFRVKLASREKVGPVGQIEILLDGIPEKSGLLELHLAAERAETQAGMIYLNENPKAWREAMAHFQEAIPLWRTLGEKKRQARAVYCVTVLARLLNQAELALTHGRQAQALFIELDDPLHQAYTLNEMGIVYLNRGEFSEARTALESALTLWRNIDYSLGEGTSQSNLCLVLRGEGKVRECLPCFEKARALMGKAEAPIAEASILISLGRLHDLFAKPQAAVACYETAQAIFQKVDNRLGLARVHNNLGAYYRRLGRYQLALGQYRDALGLFQALENRRWQARTLNNLGNLYLVVGSGDHALTYLEPALRLRRELGDKPGEIATSLNLAAALDRLGYEQRASDLLRKAMQLAQGSKRLRTRANVLVHLARHEQRWGRPARALPHIEASLKLLEDQTYPQQLARVRVKRAHLLVLLDQAAVGLADLTAAKTFFVALGDTVGEANAVFVHALALQNMGQSKEALALAKQAVAKIETLRSALAIRQLRDAFFGTQRAAYELLVDLHMTWRPGGPNEVDLAAALEAGEQGRARAFLELMAEADHHIDGGIEPDFLAQWEIERTEVTALANRLEKLRLNKALAEEENTARLALQTAQQNLAAKEDQLRRRNPRYASLSQPKYASAAEIQSLADEKTSLLLFSLGERASYGWWVGHDGMHSFTLPSRSRIESLARKVCSELKVVDPSRHTQRESLLLELSQMLLGPVRGRLRGERLVVVSEGVLNYLPFGVLPIGQTEVANSRLLLEALEVVNLPSASAMVYAWPDKPPARNGIAIFADPVFQREDKRLKQAGIKPPGTGNTRSNQAGRILDRLPATRKEAEAIAAMVGGEGSLTALGFQASRETLLATKLGDFRWLHFATHGRLNTTYPGLSSLALSQFDERGRPRDGFLRLHDIYNLKLNSQLVVLSGCETALGRDIAGEGLVGLTRGFLYAGSHGVIASLWPVPERATAMLMSKLYQHIQQDGMSPAAALRSASLVIRTDRRWRHPYYWAGFTYQGSWRKTKP